MSFQYAERLFAAYQGDFSMINKSQCSKASSRTHLEALKKELDKVARAIDQIDHATPEHLAYAATDLLLIIAKKIDVAITEQYEREY